MPTDNPLVREIGIDNTVDDTDVDLGNERIQAETPTVILERRLGDEAHVAGKQKSDRAEEGSEGASTDLLFATGSRGVARGAQNPIVHLVARDQWTGQSVREQACKGRLARARSPGDNGQRWPGRGVRRHRKVLIRLSHETLSLSSEPTRSVASDALPSA